ncbi:putative nucleolar protein 10/Enp2 [Helianthus anomalus]
MLISPFNMIYISFMSRMGRDIIYDCWSCDLICVASSPDLYRINIEQAQAAANPMVYEEYIETEAGEGRRGT